MVALIREDRVFINGVILAELLHGARIEAEVRKVRSALAAVEWIESGMEIHARAGRLGFELRRRGVTVPITDCIIAAGAESVGSHIFTLDGHFKDLAEVSSFELMDPPPDRER